jgi:hypothetical protein
MPDFFFRQLHLRNIAVHTVHEVRAINDEPISPAFDEICPAVRTQPGIQTAAAAIFPNDIQRGAASFIPGYFIEKFLNDSEVGKIKKFGLIAPRQPQIARVAVDKPFPFVRG